jgi:heat shock protein HslJ
MRNRTRLSTTLGVALAAIILSTAAVLAQEPGVASPAPSISPEAIPVPAQPEGTWDVQAYDAWGEGLVEPRKGSELSLSMLTRGRLEGQTGCGEYHGGYSVEGERIGLGIVSKGFGECGAKRTEEAVAFSVALEAVTTWTASATGLELLDGDGDVRVVLERPAFTDVTGTWVAQRYARPNGQPVVPLEDVPIILDLAADGGVTGSSGCRFLDGEYTSEGTRILIGPIEPIGPACTGDARKQERRLFALFGEITRWERDVESLTFSDAFGQPLLVLREQLEVALSPPPSPEADPTVVPADDVE